MQIEANMEGAQLRDGKTKERVPMEKNWKQLKKQTDRILLNATGFYEAVKGITGSA